MNLLENELTLSCIQLRNCRYDDALSRLIETENIFGENIVLGNNISVVRCVKSVSKDSEGQQENNLNQQNQDNREILLTLFEQIILCDPLNYIGYYNLFNFHIKNSNYKQALKSLIQSITALQLSKALHLKQQRMLKLLLKQQCTDSTIFHLIKAIIHLKNQKYIIAISELNEVVKRSLLKSDKLVILESIKLIFHALEEKQKQEQTQLKIRQLEKSTMVDRQKWIDSSFRLNCTLLMPQVQTELTVELSKRLQEFAALLKDAQLMKLKKSSKTSELIFKQINPSQLKKPLTNKQNLFDQLRLSILQSPLYTKSQSKKLSRSRNSEQKSMNSSQQQALLTDRSQQYKLEKLSLSFTPSSELVNSLYLTRDETQTKKMNSSLNMQELNSKKKAQNIYSLSRKDQGLNNKVKETII